MAAHVHFTGVGGNKRPKYVGVIGPGPGAHRLSDRDALYAAEWAGRLRVPYHSEYHPADGNFALV